MSRRSEKSNNTRVALISAARELFAQRGYADVATAEIIRLADSSRGTMYHHFVDKQALFRAVYEQVQQDMVQHVLLKMQGTTDTVDALVIALRAFLRACRGPDKARIGLVDAPAVLGWLEWRKLDEEYALGAVVAALEAGVAAKQLRADLPVRPMAHMVLAALGEAGLMIVSADDPDAAQSEAERALLCLLNGLRAHRE